MAAAHGRTSPRLSEELLAEPGRFDFFQAVRLLEWIARERSPDLRRQRQPVGQDALPEREVVRFRALPALSFPTASIHSIRQAANGQAPARAETPLEMTVAFLGLSGPAGVMPHHYTALLLRRIRNKDYSLRDWLDIFHHRLISLFYRSWEKYRLPFSYERYRLAPAGTPPDTVTQGLFCLAGFGTKGLRGRIDVPDEAFLHYAGHFSAQARPAVSLEALLEDYFEMTIRVQQCQGQWLYLEDEDLAVMPSRKQAGQNNLLGRNCVAGARVWDVQSKFRLRVGPLNYTQFRGLMPNGDDLRALCQMTRTYVGPDIDFDVQVVLEAREVPPCQLAKSGDRPQLGWNTWLHAKARAQDADDAVFAIESI